MHKNDFADNTQKYFIMTMGAPGCGKNFWIDNFLATMVADNVDNWVVLETDAIIEEWAAEAGLTYSESFGKFNFKDVEKEFSKRLNQAIADGKNIIWNQTNMTIKSRTSKLARIPADYHKRLINFIVSSFTLTMQLKKREEETNGAKKIPMKVITQMLSSYQRPDKTEGWDVITEIKR
jgi:predicted kinase